MTQIFQDPPEKLEAAQYHRERIQRHLNNRTFGCPWCGQMVTPITMDTDTLSFDRVKLSEHNVSIGPAGDLYLNPGVLLRAHHKSCEGYALHRKDLRRLRRAPGFGFGADRDTLDRDWGGS